MNSFALDNYLIMEAPFVFPFCDEEREAQRDKLVAAGCIGGAGVYTRS